MKILGFFLSSLSFHGIPLFTMLLFIRCFSIFRNAFVLSDFMISCALVFHNLGILRIYHTKLRCPLLNLVQIDGICDMIVF